MPSPIKLSIDLKKLKKSWMKEHSNGALYCELIVYTNDEADKYGNTHAVKQGMPKAAREAGEKAGYCGNGQFLERRGNDAPQSKPQARPASPPKDDWDDSEDDIPF